MPSSELLHAVDLVVALDYGQFSLQTSEVDIDGDLEQILLREAVRGDGIAQRDGVTVLRSPHQNNFEMQLRLEVWDTEPDDDLREWQEAFEVHLDIGAYGLVYASPTMDSTTIPAPQGQYHALITGRGFLGRGWPGSTEPGDIWRIQIWPATGPALPARLATFQLDRPPTSQPVFLEAGRAAATRINADLRKGLNSRSLTDQHGVVRVSRTFPTTRRRLYGCAADLSRWTSGNVGTAELVVGDYYLISDVNPDSDSFDGLPTGESSGDGHDWFGFELHGTFLELDPPSTATTRLEWVLHTDMGNRRREELVLTRPTTLRTRLIETRDGVGAAETTMTIEHFDLPVAWVDDFTDVWRCKLEAGRNYSPFGG